MLRAQLAVVLNGKAEGVSAHGRDRSQGNDASCSQPAICFACSARSTRMEPQFRKSAQQQLLVEMLLFDSLFSTGPSRSRTCSGARQEESSDGCREQPAGQSARVRAAGRARHRWRGPRSDRRRGPATRRKSKCPSRPLLRISPAAEARQLPSANEGQLREMKRATARQRHSDSNRSRD